MIGVVLREAEGVDVTAFQNITGQLIFSKILEAYRQEAFVDGKLVLLVVVRSAQVNTNPDDALFDPDRLKGGG